MDKESATTDYGLVLMTASSQQEGEANPQALMETHMAACVTDLSRVVGNFSEGFSF